MNSLLAKGKQKRLFLGLTLVVLWLPLLPFRFAMNSTLIFLFSILAAVGSLVALSFLVTLSLPTARSVGPALVSPPSLPQTQRQASLLIPTTAAQAHRMLTDAQFELFSAAVLIAVEKERGLTFFAHSGKSGDRGIDVLLHNGWGGNVLVQAKRYARNVGGPALIHFKGSLELHKAVYGYVVTTAGFTKEAQRVINQSDSRIRGVDGRKLDIHLQHHAQEIDLIYQELLRRTTG